MKKSYNMMDKSQNLLVRGQKESKHINIKVLIILINKPPKVLYTTGFY